MELTYTTKDIDLLTNHVKKYYANDVVKPTIILTTNLISIGTVLYFIHRVENYNFALIMLLSFFIFRIFMIFHDLNHGSFYPKTANLNNKVAKCIEIFCMFTASSWKQYHAVHHYTHANLLLTDETRTVFTTTEYNNLSPNKKIAYDIIRNPFIFFSIVPIHIFWTSKIVNKEYLLITKYLSFLFLLFKLGSNKLLLSFLLAHYIEGCYGTMFFHLQHQVNIGFLKQFDKTNALIKNNADLLGSSVLTIPLFLEHFTFGIEYHNIHHFDSLVPSYNLKRCYNDAHTLKLLKDTKVGYMQMFKSLFHVIHNEETGRYESSPFFRRLGLEG